MPSFDLDPSGPFFLFRRKNEPTVHLYRGTVTRSRALVDIPRRHGAPQNGAATVDSVSMVPFAQARERGFPVHDGGEPVVTLVVDHASDHDLEDVLAALPQRKIELADVQFDVDNEAYEGLVRRIIDDEIGTGQGSNFVIARRCDARIDGFSIDHALSIFRSLLVHEFGSYWTFLFFDGSSFFLGATPERHISARDGEVMMNPISGTFRKGDSDLASLRRSFLSFLEDEKEVFELFMVTDEELKVMCELCDHGGAIVGPLLKEMARLVHTEYLLIGRSTRDVVDLLRDSMFAPTVTGSPVLSAFRTIHRYEQGTRSYYGGTIALLGRDEGGAPTLDAPITIRTLEIDGAGKIAIRVGATLVRGSDPSSEVKETEVKIAGVMNAVRAKGAAAPPARQLERLDNEEIQIRLQRRNLYLSRFWFEPQTMRLQGKRALQGRSVTIIDNEDAFSKMLQRVVEQLGAEVQVVPFDAYAIDAADLTIVGPGPGDPRSESDPKMVRLREIVSELLRLERPMLAECLGHQVTATVLGLPIIKKQIPFQGAQEVIDLFGAAERVGFYNTFAAVAPDRPIDGIEIAHDPTTREIHAIRGASFISVQFHLESILTPRGHELTRDLLVALLGPRATPARRP